MLCKRQVAGVLTTEILQLFALAQEGELVLPNFADPTRWEDLVAILNECQRISPQM